MPSPTRDVIITRLTIALFDAAPGYTYLTEFRNFAAQQGDNALANVLINYLNLNDHDLATRIVDNLRIPQSQPAGGDRLS